MQKFTFLKGTKYLGVTYPGTSSKNRAAKQERVASSPVVWDPAQEEF